MKNTDAADTPAYIDEARRSLAAGLLALPLLAKCVSSAHATSTTPTPIKLAVSGFEHRTETINGVSIHYTICGSGEPVLLLHGWPMTWYEWASIIPTLASRHTVIAPDLRGIGGSARPKDGYDLETKAQDARQLLLRLGFGKADIIGHDLGTEIAAMLAFRHPEMVRKLVLMEAALIGLPGSEVFLQHAPWWFAFHDVPGLAETVLTGNEGKYLDWFYTNHTFAKRGIPSEIRDAYVAAYTGQDALRGGFEHYRAFSRNMEQFPIAAAGGLPMPVLALGGNVVGDVLARQLTQIGANVTGAIIAECGHFIPDEQPQVLLEHLQGFLA